MTKPKLCFDLSAKREVVKLSHIASPNARIGWQNLRRSEFKDDGDVYIITGTDFESGLVNFKGCKFVDLDRYEMDPKIKIHENDILVTKDGTIGKVAIVKGLDKKATLNAGVFVLNDIATSVDREYLYHYLRSPLLLKFIKSASTGGTILHLNQSVLLDFPISLPDLEEQQKIAAFFTALDEKISVTEKLLNEIEKICSTVLATIYCKDIRFKQPDGSSFPKWNTHQLNQLLRFQNGINASKDKFGTGIKLISVKEVLNDSPVTYNSIKSSVEVDEKVAQSFSVEYGDVLFQRSSETAEEAGSANVYLDFRPAVFGGFVIRGKKIADYHPQFLKMALRSTPVRRQLVRLAQGAQHFNIGQEQLSTVEIQVPCLEEQEKIAELITAFEDKKATVLAKLNSLRRLKQAFMQQIFV